LKKVLYFLLITFFALHGLAGCRNKKNAPEFRTDTDVQTLNDDDAIAEIDSAEDDYGTELENAPEQENAREYWRQGRSHLSAGELNAAIENFENAKKLDPHMRAIWSSLGEAYFRQGRYEDAIINFTQAIQLSRQIGIERHEMYARRGEAYYYLGNYNAVIDDLSQAIRLEDSIPEYWNDRGEAHRNKGEYTLAINDYENAIQLNSEYVIALNNLGLAFYGTDDYENAVKYFSEAIGIDRRYASAWNNRGCVWLDRGEYDKAIADFTQILKLDDYDYAIAYSNRSRAYLGKKDYPQTLIECDQAIKINKNYPPAFNNRAHAYREMGEYEKALTAYRECLEKAQASININDISVYAWYLAGQVYQKFPYLNDVKSQDFWFKFAKGVAREGIGYGISNAEKIRRNLGIQGANLMARMIYLYYAGVDFEAQFGSGENVLLYSESLRNRGFLDQVGAEAAIRLDGVTKNEFNRFKELRNIIDEQQAVINSYNNTALTGDTNIKYSAAIERRTDAENKLAELDRTIGGRIPKYANLRNPELVTLDKAIEFCGNDRAVLEYVIWDTDAYKPVKGYESWDIKGAPPNVNSYCLVITKNGLTPVPLKTGFNYSRVINEMLNDFNPSSFLKASYEKQRNELYDQLIKPVLPFLENIKNITIVPDGDLARIPFDMLRENSNPGTKDFGERYAISLSPSLSVSILTQKNDSVEFSPILFFANDIYNGRDGRPWPNIPGVIYEIELIQKLADRHNIAYTPHLQENATKKRLQQLSVNNELEKYPMIHFACHGYFNREHPDESGLVLFLADNDPNLTIPEIAALDINARMVILSACETGLSEKMYGQGMIGLVRAFMVAGAVNVGVSLWKINDFTTVPFMESLYQKALIDKKPFREAYKEVKEIFRSSKYESLPYYWAAFTMYE
jgi:CHAT domain-containing protein/tetratricopeptide (TPR) repeat protein